MHSEAKGMFKKFRNENTNIKTWGPGQIYTNFSSCILLIRILYYISPNIHCTWFMNDIISFISRITTLVSNFLPFENGLLTWFGGCDGQHFNSDQQFTGIYCNNASRNILNQTHTRYSSSDTAKRHGQKELSVKKLRTCTWGILLNLGFYL